MTVSNKEITNDRVNNNYYYVKLNNIKPQSTDNDLDYSKIETPENLSDKHIVMHLKNEEKLAENPEVTKSGLEVTKEVIVSIAVSIFQGLLALLFLPWNVIKYLFVPEEKEKPALDNIIQDISEEILPTSPRKITEINVSNPTPQIDEGKLRIQAEIDKIDKEIASLKKEFENNDSEVSQLNKVVLLWFNEMNDLIDAKNSKMQGHLDDAKLNYETAQKELDKAILKGSDISEKINALNSNKLNLEKQLQSSSEIKKTDNPPKIDEPVKALETIAQVLFSKIGKNFELKPGKFEVKLTENELHKLKIGVVQSIDGIKDEDSGGVIMLGVNPEKTGDFHYEGVKKIYKVKGEYFPDQQKVTFDEGFTLYREVNLNNMDSASRTMLRGFGLEDRFKYAYASLFEMEYVPTSGQFIMRTKKDLRTKFCWSDYTEEAKKVSRSHKGAVVNGDIATYSVTKDYKELLNSLKKAYKVKDEVEALKKWQQMDEQIYRQRNQEKKIKA